MNIYSPQIGQSHSIDLSIHLCSPSNEMDMHTPHFYSQSITTCIRVSKIVGCVPCNERSPSQGPFLFDRCHNHCSGIYSCLGHHPTVCTSVCQRYSALGSGSNKFTCDKDEQGCPEASRKEKNANLIAVVSRAPDTAMPAVLLRRLSPATVHTEHIFSLPPNQAMILIFVMAKPAGIPLFAC